MHELQTVKNLLLGHLRMVGRIGTPKQAEAAAFWREKLGEVQVDNVVPMSAASLEMPQAACFARRDRDPGATGAGGGK